MVTFEEKYLDGTVRSHPGVRVRNPLQTPIRFTGKNALVRETQVIIGTQPDGSPKYGVRTLDIDIPPGATVVLPADVVDELVQMRCLQCDMPVRLAPQGPRKKGTPLPVCRDPSHPKKLIGGLATMIHILREDNDEAQPVELAANLDPKHEPLPQYDPIDLHERVMRRLAGSAK